MTDPQGSESSGAESSETPGYTSPTEQLLNSLPFGIFRTLAERMGNKGGGGGVGSFEFSIAEMRELHRQFSDEVDALEEMVKKSTQSGQSLQALAPDEASMKHYQAAQEHYGKLDKAILQQLEFAKGFRDATGAAIGLKESDEETAAGHANKISRAV